MRIRVIDNKKLLLTNDEYLIYDNMCKSYTQGKDLFKDLFETDDDGIIVFLRPPSKMFSMETMMFLQNVMLHQHIRKMYDEHNKALEVLKTTIEEIKIIASKEIKLIASKSLPVKDTKNTVAKKKITKKKVSKKKATSKKSSTPAKK